MRKIIRRSIVWSGVVASAIIAPSPATAQTGSQSIAQRRLASLGDILNDIGDSYTALGGQQKKLQRDQAQLNDFAANFQMNQTLLNTARAGLDARAQAAQSRRKWRCNAYNSLHDYPSQCSDPSKGGVWIDDQSAPPPDPAEKAQLDSKQKDLDAQKASLNQKLQDYTKAANDYNTKTGDLTKKIASLPAPASAMNDVKQLVFDDSAAKGSTPDPATKKTLGAMEGLLQGTVDGISQGGMVGKGQCTDLAHVLRPDLGAASTWKANPADKVFGGTGAPTSPLAACATMFNRPGTQELYYPARSSGNHWAMCVTPSPGDKSMLVFDQFGGIIDGKPPGFRLLYRLGGIDAHQADIQRGEEAAKEAGLDPTNSAIKKIKDGRALDYWHWAYKEAGYNPSNDADNYYRQPPPSPLP